MARQAWVDFNDVDEEGVVRTPIDFAEKGFEPKAGDVVVVGDDEGNLAKGEVFRVERDGLVAIALKPGAFWAADHKPSVRLRRSSPADTRRAALTWWLDERTRR